MNELVEGGMVPDMKTLIIVSRDSMLGELEELLRENGINAYTILSNVQGKGVTGRVQGTFYQPDIDQADKAVSALKALHAARSLSGHGQPIPLKVFTFPCEERV
jgi:hypothetical protein